MTLPTSVYAAYHGYSWSNTPPDLTVAQLNRFCRHISSLRGDFPDPLQVEMGLVVENGVVAAFTLQNVEKRDSEGRASDYYSMAFFPACMADEIDFVQLMNNDLFWFPSRQPPTSIDFNGPRSADYDKSLPAVLQAEHRVFFDDLHAIGAFVRDVHSRFDQMICRLCNGNVLEVRINS